MAGLDMGAAAEESVGVEEAVGRGNRLSESNRLLRKSVAVPNMNVDVEPRHRVRAPTARPIPARASPLEHTAQSMRAESPIYTPVAADQAQPPASPVEPA